MKLFYLALAVAPLSVFAQASSSAATSAGPSALPLLVSVERDNYCWVVDGPINCRKGAGTGYPVARQITDDDQFAVTCKVSNNVFGIRAWDYIPNWDCWVPVRYVRGDSTCESDVPWCH